MRLHGADGRQWEVLRSFSQRWEAELLDGLLSSFGFNTWFIGDDAGSAYPGATLTGYLVLVPEDQLEEARQVAEEGVNTTFELSEGPDDGTGRPPPAGGASDPPPPASPAATQPAPAGHETERLTSLLLDLLAMPCVTGEERPIADWLEQRYRSAGEAIRRVGASVVVGEMTGDRPTVLLVGHLDVVPPTDDDRQPRRDGDVVTGRGASDMKSGLAVAMDCFEDAELRAGPLNVVLVAYAGEEGDWEHNELGQVLDAVPELAQAGLAIVLEPTDLEVQLGCLGALQAEAVVSGSAAHAARPWLGVNALTEAASLLTELGALEPVDVEVEGLVYREVAVPTQGWTANARNVVPDTFTLNLNYRFAPDKTADQAQAHLEEIVAGRAALRVVDVAPPAPPRRDDPLVQRFIDAADAAVAPKQAWTDVARFAAAGVPALNYGPGLTAQAHQAGEYVPVANLGAARAALARFLEDPAPD